LCICPKKNAELREKERELQEILALLKSVTVERDQALHGTKPALTGIQVRPHTAFSVTPIRLIFNTAKEPVTI